MRMKALVIALFLLLLPAVAQAKDGKALMLTVFGTSTEATVTFDELLPLVKKQFPNRDVVVPYTSGVIRNKLNANISDPTKKILSPAEMLEKFKTEGYKDVEVVSTLVFNGVEHDKLKAAVDDFSAANKGIKVSYTPPLLSEEANLQPVVDSLKKHIIQDGINVVVAHGTHDGHAVEKIYLQLAELVSKSYPNARLGSVEGVPPIEKTLAWVKASKASDVRFLVFMFVAGDHAENDIAGNEDDSYFSLVKKMGKTPSVARMETSAGNRMVSLGLDPDYRKILLGYFSRHVSQ